MRLLDVVIGALVPTAFTLAVAAVVLPPWPTKKEVAVESEVVIEQACVNGYEWVVLVNAQGQSVAIEQVYKASEVPGACAQPVECQDL